MSLSVRASETENDSKSRVSTPAANHVWRFLVFVALYYAGLLFAFNAFTTSFSREGLVWYAWCIACGITLFFSAKELAALTFWCTSSGLLDKSDMLVPQELSPADIELLEDKTPRVAFILPANGEVNSSKDADAFADRLTDIVSRTVCPAIVRAELFLLFDTDPTRPGNENCVENERELFAAVGERLLEGGFSKDHVERFQLREYRDKDASRRTKQGSIDIWLTEEGEAFDFVLVLDADSGFVEPDRRYPDTMHVLDRLVVAMLREPQLAMIQTPRYIVDDVTWLGWQQNINSKMAMNYLGPLENVLFGTQQPSYGHNLLLRRTDLTECYQTGVPLEFLSHDFIEASMMIEEGRWCTCSYAVCSTEHPEQTVTSFLQREQRWARGNVQWSRFLFTHPRLPIGPRVFLTLGILNYFAALCGIALVTTSVGVVVRYGSDLQEGAALPAIVLLAALATSLLIPKVIAASGGRARDKLNLGEVVGNIAIGILLMPPMMFHSALFFLRGLLSLFGHVRWKPRSAGRLQRSDAIGSVCNFLPASILGSCMLAVAWENLSFGVGGILLSLSLLPLIVSPVTMWLVSRPMTPHRARCQSTDIASEPLVSTTTSR